MQGIYCIEQVDSGRKYYGSSNDIQRRLHQHLRDLRNQKHHNLQLQRAFDKYGEKKFKFYVIEETRFNHKSELLEYEQTWLDKNIDGYNMAPAAGGDCISQHPNRSEIVQKIGNAVRSKIKTMTDSERKIRFSYPGELNPNWKGRRYCKTCSVCQENEISIRAKTCTTCRDRKGPNNPFFNRKHTNETKAILRERQTGDNSRIKGIDPAKLPYTKKYQITYPDGNIKVVAGLKIIAEEFNCSIENVHATIKRIRNGDIPTRGVFAGIMIAVI